MHVRLFVAKKVNRKTHIPKVVIRALELQEVLVTAGSREEVVVAVLAGCCRIIANYCVLPAQ